MNYRICYCCYLLLLRIHTFVIIIIIDSNHHHRYKNKREKDDCHRSEKDQNVQVKRNNLNGECFMSVLFVLVASD